MRFHEEKFASEYHGRLSREGYPGALLPAVLGELSGVDTLLDAGGGSGFFAVPAASKGIKVTVVDPAVPMTSILRKTIEEKKIAGIKISNQKWESWEGEKHNAVLSAHSLYPMDDQVSALRKMFRYADKRIAVVRDDEGQMTLGDAVRSSFSSPRKVKNLARVIESVIESESLRFKKISVNQIIVHKIEDVRTEAEYYTYFLNLSSGSADKIFTLLKSICTFNNGCYQYESLHSDFIYIF